MLAAATLRYQFMEFYAMAHLLAAATLRYQFIEFYAMAHDMSFPSAFPGLRNCSGALPIVGIEERMFSEKSN